MRFLVRSVLILGVAALIIAAGGFAHFIKTVDHNVAPSVEKANGIIVLTGGGARIAAAIDLLRQKRADKLLISGVYEGTSREALQSQFDDSESWFECCIDIDREALNTVGNAEIASKWANQNSFTSVILVTSDYHMPRSLLEFQRVLPGVDIIPHPVRGERPLMASWWYDPTLGKRLLQEYSKYVVVLTREKSATFSPEKALALLKGAVHL